MARSSSPVSSQSTPSNVDGDWIAIRELTARYNRAADEGDIEAFLSVFTEDGVMETRVGGDTRRYVGHDEIAAIPTKTGGQQVHITTDPIIEIRGDTASQRCTLLLCRRSDGMFSGMTAGRYQDELVRTLQGWRFLSRTATVDLDGEGKFVSLSGN